MQHSYKTGEKKRPAGNHSLSTPLRETPDPLLAFTNSSAGSVVQEAPHLLLPLQSSPRRSQRRSFCPRLQPQCLHSKPGLGPLTREYQMFPKEESPAFRTLPSPARGHSTGSTNRASSAIRFEIENKFLVLSHTLGVLLPPPSPAAFHCTLCPNLIGISFLRAQPWSPQPQGCVNGFSLRKLLQLHTLISAADAKGRVGKRERGGLEGCSVWWMRNWLVGHI